jgi:hypothetical protein
MRSSKLEKNRGFNKRAATFVTPAMFTLDPECIVARVKASGQPPRVPTLAESALRGTIGFTLVSLAGFAPWVLAGRWFYRNVGEIGLYVTCALAFIGLSGPLLHRLIIGPGSLSRCYKIFSLAFVGYAAVWTIAWMSMARSAGGVTAGIVGAIAGIAVMGTILAVGFKSPEAMLKVMVALFVGNLIGYFVGEWAYNGINALREGNATGFILERQTRSILSKTAWGLFYGLGFGAGIGFAFHACQAKARKLLAASSQT